MTALTDQLRALAYHQHSDLSIAGEAADEIEHLRYAIIAAEEFLLDKGTNRALTLSIVQDALHR